MVLEGLRWTPRRGGQKCCEPRPCRGRSDGGRGAQGPRVDEEEGRQEWRQGATPHGVREASAAGCTPDPPPDQWAPFLCWWLHEARVSAWPSA